MVRVIRHAAILFVLGLAAGMASASVTLTVDVSSLAGGLDKGAYVQAVIQNCASPTLWGTNTAVRSPQRFFPTNGVTVFTIPDNVTQIACQGNFLSYYTFNLVNGSGVTTLIGNYELPPGRFALANLAPLTTPPVAPGIIQGPTGPAGPPGPVGSEATWVNPTVGFPYADIGLQVNAAIASLKCGTIEIPAGTFSFATPIGPVPQCITLRGQNSGTNLDWVGNGPAIIASSASAPGQTVQGHIGGFSLTGHFQPGQVGLYQGGDPNCTGSCTTNPSTNVGYNYEIRDLTIYNMDNGIVWGNETFNVEWDNVISANNSQYGWYYPSTATGGGQVVNLYHSSLSGNAKGAWLIQQNPQVTFAGFGLDVEYNGSQTAPNPTPVMSGGTYTCYDCHVEANFGPFVEVAGNNQNVNFFGGTWIVNNGGSTADPYLVKMDGGKAGFSLDGTLLYIQHNVTNLVTNPTNSTTLQVRVQPRALVDPAFHLKAITASTGPGISWCMPYDNSTGTTPGKCYNGNLVTNPIATQAAGVSPAGFPASAAVMSWNGDSASGGVDFYDTYASTAPNLYAFRFNSNASGTEVPLGSILRSGFINFAGYEVNGVVGYTGFKTAGSCVLSISGGIITNVTGC